MDEVAEVDLHMVHPEGLELKEEFSSDVHVHHDQRIAFEGADFVYTKNWSSYKNYGQTHYPAKDWEITLDKLGDASFMHCLPVRRNVVVSGEVLESPQSVVIQQAANRVPAAQAVLIQILQNL